ncbi:MAG: hypothetical protein ABIQ53_02900 [Terracoccus sp.]
MPRRGRADATGRHAPSDDGGCLNDVDVYPALDHLPAFDEPGAVTDARTADDHETSGHNHEPSAEHHNIATDQHHPGLLDPGSAARA